VWWFEAPIMQTADRMGTGYALYDMIQDRKMIKTVSKMVDGDLSVIRKDGFLSLISGITLPIEPQKIKIERIRSESFHSESDRVISKLRNLDHLYFISSRKDLSAEKVKISILIALFSISGLAVSAILSLFLSRQIAHPLGDMATKATAIAEGQKDISFENRPNDYWELRKLSRAFNSMLINLKATEERARYTELLENVDDAVYLFDSNGKILEANEATYAQLGYSPETFFQLNIRTVIPENDAGILLDQISGNALKQDQGKIRIETYHTNKEGFLIPFEINSRVITYRGKKVVLNVARNIRERREAERALRESEERFRSVVEYSHDGILIFNDCSRIIYVNNKLSNILAYSRQEIEGMDVGMLFGDENHPVLKTCLLPEDENKEFQALYEATLVRKDGEKRCCKISVSLIKGLDENVKTMFQVIDITDQLKAEKEKKQLEVQLLHAQKMEAIGTLAGGIAHDFNNLLMAIQGRISLMLLHTSSDHPHYEHIREIGNTIKSAANLTKQILGFARAGKYEVKPACPNDLVEKSIQIFSRTNKGIRIEKKYEKNVSAIEVDPGQIEQVLLNLFVNAGQAMPEGGDLFLQTENVILKPKYCKPFEVPPGNYVKISVTDTGIGMDKKLMDRIFEPFFTTKEVGKGTGLGLASAYGIIKNHNGIIRVYSEKNCGSTFNVYLPASKKQVPRKKESRLELTRGNETILIVDDEEGPIEVAELMLKELGYEVIRAKSGKEATELVNKNMNKLDMVILDMVMPEMSGSETYDRLKEINPGIKVLLSSGYSANIMTEEILKRGCNGFIQKPFDITQLSRKVREVLDL
jgi:two-component system cell cycle sensor histidine kinase/response regulator CckA